MSTERALRISQSVKRELSDMIRRDLKDPRLSGLISFTEVECTSDLRNLKVFVSVFGTTANTTAGQAANASDEARVDAAQKLSSTGVAELTPAEKATAGVLSCLNEESGYIRGELCRRLKLRFAPELQFLPDMSLERGSKVSELLAKISRGEV
jgi:ribosome-binding factor A